MCFWSILSPFTSLLQFLHNSPTSLPSQLHMFFSLKKIINSVCPLSTANMYMAVRPSTGAFLFIGFKLTWTQMYLPKTNRFSSFFQISWAGQLNETSSHFSLHNLFLIFLTISFSLSFFFLMVYGCESLALTVFLCSLSMNYIKPPSLLFHFKGHRDWFTLLQHSTKVWLWLKISLCYLIKYILKMIADLTQSFSGIQLSFKPLHRAISFVFQGNCAQPTESIHTYQTTTKQKFKFLSSYIKLSLGRRSWRLLKQWLRLFHSL